MHKLTYLKLSLSIIVWGSVYHTANYLVKYMNPVTLGFTRYLIASVILLVVLRKKRGRLIDPVLFKNHWLLLVSTGVFGIGLYNLVFFTAEQYTSAYLVAIIFSFNPCLTTFIASILFKQRVSAFGYLGMLIALLGTFGVINFGNPACGRFFCTDILSHLSKGEIYSILVCVFAASYSILNRRASMHKIDSLTIVTFASVFGTVLLFIFAIFMGDFSHLEKNPLLFWIVLFYTSVIGSVVSYFWFSEAISQLGVGKVAVFLNGVPFSAILIGVIFLGKPISWSVAISGMVIITGVIFTNLAVNRGLLKNPAK